MTNTNKLNPDKLTRFNKILSGLQFNTASLLRLLGDEFADRGMNDYFTLKILEQLESKKVPFEIIVSNHGVEFLLALEKFNKGEKIKDYKTLVNPVNSMNNLQTLLKKGYVIEAEIASIANKCYQPSLKLLSYSLTHSQGKPEISIYSHGKVGLNMIATLAQELDVEYKDKTIFELAGTIDEINSVFKDKVLDNKVGKLYNKLNNGTALFQILWERDYNNIVFPKMQHGYCLFLIHGHDKTGQSEEHITTLDNDLGKSYTDNKGQYQTHNKGQYQTHYSNNIALKDFPRHVMTCQFKQLQKKELELRNKNHTQAAERVKELINTLQSLNVDKNNIESISQAFDVARPVLATHRDWYRFFTKFFYNPPTASATILQNLQAAINAQISSDNGLAQSHEQNPPTLRS